MRSASDLGEWAVAKFRAGHRAWLGEADAGAAREFRFPLQPPGEAEAGAAPDAVAAWAAGWRAWASGAPEGVEVEWAIRRWPSLGVQRLPARVVLRGSAALASVAGSARAWGHLVALAGRLERAWPTGAIRPALPGVTADLAKLDAADADRLVAVVAWFLDHPESGLLPRQVPVEGVDTKWLERHRRLVERVAAALGVEGLGLAGVPRTYRVRVLDDGLDAALRDFSAPAAELATLAWAPERVLVCENVACVATLPPLRGVVAVHGNGLAAPLLAEVGWIRDSAVAYWGDLDSHGFAILGLVRAALPQTESVLMDVATLERFRPLAVPEPQPFRGRIGHLTASETAALERLREGDLRLEQERLEGSHVLASLQERVEVGR